MSEQEREPTPEPETQGAAAALAPNLTGDARNAADQALQGLEDLSNHIFDAGETALHDALKVVDAAQTRVSELLTTVTNLLGGKVGPPKG